MIANRLTPRRLWVNGSDQALAGHRYVGDFSFLDAPDRADLQDALSTIAASGPRTRVGLIPQPGRRSWTQEPLAPLSVQELPDEVANDDSAALLQYLRRRPGGRHPLELHVSPRRIAIDADHGLGDGRFIVDLMAAVFALCDGRRTPWLTNGGTRLALPKALATNFGIHPARTRMAWRCATGLSSANAARPEAQSHGELVPWSPSFALAVAHVDADVQSAVDEWRRVNAGKVGSAAIWLYLVRQALWAAALDMTNEVMVAFDCRRYLSQHAKVNGNFVMGLEIPFAADEQVSTVSQRLRECVSSALPLAAMGVLSGRALLRSEPTSLTSPSRELGKPANLMYTDLGHITLLDDLPWVRKDERAFTGLLDPGGPEGITVFNTRIGNTRNISISFHDNVFDAQTIKRAAAYLENAIQFLR